MKAADSIPPAEPSADSISELVLDARRKRNRALLVLFVAIPTVSAIIGVIWWITGQEAAERDIAEAWNQASACLVGVPLAEGERASLRMRAVQLAAVTSELDRGTEARWPNRCGDPVAVLHEALRKHGRDKDGDEGLAARSEQFAVDLRKAEVMHDLSAQIDGLYEAAAKLGLQAEPVSLQVPTPEPTPGFNLDSLPDAARISPLQFALDSVSATPMVGTEIHVMVHDRKVDETPILCTFSPTGADRCRPLGGELIGKSGLRLAGTVDEGGEPLVFAGKDGDDGIYRSSGDFSKITTMQAQSAYAAKDGYVAIAGFNDGGEKGGFELVEQAAPKAPTTTLSVEPRLFGKNASQVHRKQLLWGKLLVQVIDGEDEDISPRLTTADVPSREGKLAFQTIAKLDWVNAPIFGCRTQKTMVVGVGRSEGFFTFLEGDKWSSPVRIDSIAGAFGCYEGEAVFTTSWGGQQRCTPAGCKLVQGVRPVFMPFKERDTFWTGLSGKILAVATLEGRAGLRYRFAVGKNLAKKRGDQLLFDDLVRDGAVQKDSTVLGILLAGRGPFAIVLLTTPGGVYALRVDATGKVAPVTIQR
ncbi:MAG: hypothetical protein JRI68_20005 [Deltaproteobacteria bacterium]|nr:hypothetical protein [Deltaproteobacteria bacterium]